MAPTDICFAGLLAVVAVAGFLCGIAAAAAGCWVLTCMVESLSAWIDPDERGSR
jgi:hypothetical protein